MDARGDSQAKLAKRAGVSQRAVGDLLTYGQSHEKAPTIRTVSALASAYGVAEWLLMLPDMPVELLSNHRVSTLIQNFAEAPESGRENIARIAESEVRYALTTGKVSGQ